VGRAKAIIFDLDGTLLDTIDDLADATNWALEQLGLPTHSASAYKAFVGEGVRLLIESALPEELRQSSTIERCLQLMLTAYDRCWSNKTRPYAGVPELLDALQARGIPQAILSNKLDRFVQAMVSALLPGWRFLLVRGQRADRPKKPDPTVAREIAQAFGLRPEKIAFVGDTPIDVETALGAGMIAIGATWGFRTEAELRAKGAMHLIDQPAALLQLIGDRG
jgi:phosphoglycolate phosphatase